MNPGNATHRRRSSRLLTATLLALLVAGGATAWAQADQVDLETTMGRGRACTQWFYAREFDKIEALGFTDAMEAALPSMGGLAGFGDTVDTQLGGETEVVEEVETEQQGLDVYVRTAKFEKFPGEVNVQWVFDAEGAIAGMSIKPKQ